MTKPIKVIRMARAAGKTTKSLQLLQAQGGGVFLTRNALEARRIVQSLGLDKVVIVVFDHERTFIDDADMREVTLVTTEPLELRDI